MTETTLKNTNLVASRHIRREMLDFWFTCVDQKCLLPKRTLRVGPCRCFQSHVMTFSKMYTAGTTVLLERCPPYVHTSETPIECPPWWRVRHIEIEKWNWHLLSSFSEGPAASREFLCHSFDQDDTRTTRRVNILAPTLTTCARFRITRGWIFLQFSWCEAEWSMLARTMKY